MAQERSTDTVSPLVYQQVRGPGVGRWFMACWVGLIGGGFVVLSAVAILGARLGKISGPRDVLWLFVFFGLIGLAVLTGALAILLYRRCVEIDPRSGTVTRYSAWGPIERTVVFPGEIRCVRLMHDTRRTHSKRGSSAGYTVCALKVVNREGDVWCLSERPAAGEALSAFLFRRSAPDYEQLVRDDAVRLCAATGWRLDDRLERSASGFVPAASAPRAQRVEEVEPLIRAPAWMERPVPRDVRRRRHTLMLSVLGWGVLVGPMAFVAIYTFGVPLCMVTTRGQVIGLARDGPGANEPDSHGVGYRYSVDGHEYTQWEGHVSDALWAQAEQRGWIKVSYLPWYPLQSNLGPQSPIERLSENWYYLAVLPLPLVWVIVRRGKRISRAISLGRRGCMAQGMVFRRVQTAGRTETSTRMSVNGLPIYKLWQSPADDPSQIRYEFMVDGKKYAGYVPADLLGVFRRDGLVGVVYDPLHPEVHIPLPVIERYLNIN
jgi:hypothetical protein